MQRPIAHRRDAIEERPGGNLLRAKLFAAPRSDNDVRFLTDNFFGRDDAILGRFADGAVGKDVNSAGSFDQLRNPANAADRRIA